MAENNKKQEALDYHAQGKPGKIEVNPTKPYSSSKDLALAYSPGVAEPCKEIAKNKEDVYKYTAKGNLVAVISNGTAVLGLGDIGPEASKPVMEGKGLLFKIYADIDVFDIEVDATDPDRFIETVKAIAPTFGGINLEDIKAPEAFVIEEKLKAALDIPIMHDDQHGTAIVSGAALLNAVELAGKKIDQIKVVINGAGSSAIACGKLYVKLGVKKEHIFMLDSKGLLVKSREDLNEYKDFFVQDHKSATLAEMIENADVFLGLSKAGVLTQEMVKKMAKNPIVFALANPDPEISYEDAMAAREDIILATGRSDYPNQVNNVLGFPYIFRGALDVRATCINEEMKMAAAKALAALAKEPIPEEVSTLYGEKKLVFGKTSIIPKPLDPRLLFTVAPAVAKAAMESGVARQPIKDFRAYEIELQHRVSKEDQLIRHIGDKITHDRTRLVFAEGQDIKVIKAAYQVYSEKIAQPILLGNEEVIRQTAEEYGINLSGIKLIDPKIKATQAKVEEYAQRHFEKRQRKGVTLYDALRLMKERNHFGAMMLETGDADALITGVTRKYKESLEPALKVIGSKEQGQKLAGMYILLSKYGPLFLADTTININPSVKDLVDLTLLVEKTVRSFGVDPAIALLSYDNFGYSDQEDAKKVTEAVEILHQAYPNLLVDGGMQANFALNAELLKQNFPFSKLVDHHTNTLIFPNLASGNIAYKVLQQATQSEAIGPILMGVKKPYHVMQLGASVREIVNMSRIAVLQTIEK